MQQHKLDLTAVLLERQLAQANCLLTRRTKGEQIEDFDIRGELYATAMDLAPNARDQDLIAMKRWLKLSGKETVLDIAAGGGFLTKAICAWTSGSVLAVDPSVVQLTHLIQSVGSIMTLVGSPDDEQVMTQISASSIDVATSFGGIHHIRNQRTMMMEIARVLDKGGRFVAADVCGNTALSSHFDEVTAHKSLTGHKATWLTPQKLDSLVSGLPLRIGKVQMVPLNWVFMSEREMALFFKGLHAYDLPESEILEDLEQILGYELRDGKLHLNWHMLFFEIERT